MNWQVSVRKAAQNDLANARNWYEEQREGLGEEFLASISAVFVRLEQAPEEFPVYYRDYRRALSKTFPYKVFFRIKGDAVVVYRILHAVSDHTRRLR